MGQTMMYIESVEVLEVSSWPVAGFKQLGDEIL